VCATFVTGYVLIDRLWPIGTVVVLALVLAVAGFLYSRRKMGYRVALVACVGIAVCTLVPWEPARAVSKALGMHEHVDSKVVYTDHSQYSWIAIAKGTEDRNYRTFTLDALLHSSVNLAKPKVLYYGYEWLYDAIQKLQQPAGEAVNALLIGGGGYVYPHYLELTRPGSYLEVVEIDPAVTRAAHAEFGFPEDTTVQTFAMDGRNRVEELLRMAPEERPVPKFDIVFGDTFNHYSVPFQLTTVEFTQGVYDLLDDEGLYLFNMIDSYHGAQFLGRMVATCRTVFEHVYVISCGIPANKRDTFVIAASKVPLDLAGVPEMLRGHVDYTGHLLSEAELSTMVDKCNGEILTDDRAPVETLLASIVNTQETNRVARLWSAAKRYLDDEDYERALSLYKELAEINDMDPRVNFDLGLCYYELKRWDESVFYMKRSLERGPATASAYIGLGSAFCQLGQFEEGLTYLEKGLELEPRKTDALKSAARVLSHLGREEKALAYRARLTEIDPEHPTHAYDYATSLLKLERIDEALIALNALLEKHPDVAEARLAKGLILVQRATQQRNGALLQAAID
jgi:tetratricopeptide (TPR) repeat protein